MLVLRWIGPLTELLAKLTKTLWKSVYSGVRGARVPNRSILTNNIPGSLAGEEQKNVGCEILKHVYLHHPKEEKKRISDPPTVRHLGSKWEKKTHHWDFPNITVSIRNHPLHEEKE